MLRPLSATLLMLLSILFAAGAARANGDLLIVGGGYIEFGNLEIWDAIAGLRLNGRPVGILGTASSTPRSSGEATRDDLNAIEGAGTSVYIHVTSTNGAADDPATVEEIRSCGAFFFTGGDQRRVPQAFYRANGDPTDGLAAIRQILAEGGGIGGTSAGAAIMSDPMITGGYSDDALLFGAFPEGSSQDGVYTDRGLGFQPDGLYDQHHLIRGRLGRLIVATDAAGLPFGFGIDESTALLVDGNTKWAEVLGESAVFVVDVRDIIHKTDGPSWSGITLHLLDHGDRVNVATGEVAVALDRTLITVPARAAQPVTSNDVWDDFEAWRLVRDLIETQATPMARGEDARSSRGYLDLLLSKNARTVGYRGGVRPFGNDRPVYTVLNLDLAAVPPGAPFPERPIADAVTIH